jgi:hypothetical protein
MVANPEINSRSSAMQEDYVEDFLHPQSMTYERISAQDPEALSKFESHWSAGRALVVEGCHHAGLGPHWDPAYFIRHHRMEEATVADCETMELDKMLVGNFFKGFMEKSEQEGNYRVLKLPVSITLVKLQQPIVPTK